jgi:ABC-type antimicrobial peptide transport system permease subunit
VFAPRVLLVRTTGDPAAAIPSIRATVVAAEPSVAIGRADAVRDLLGGPLARPRLNAALMSMFALAALALASIGVFGVLTFHISQRTRELGIRQALGATPAQLRGIVLREGLALEGIGLAAGIAISVAVTRSARALLYDVAPSDPVAMTAAAVLLVVCGTVAVAFPALRASRVDPSVALRAE